MITLFESSAVNFETNGLGNLSDAISCTVTEETNGQFELEMQYPIIGNHYYDLALRRIIFTKPNPYSNEQPFRIYNISKPINGVVTVSAQHISYDLTGYPVSPFYADSANVTFVNLKSKSVIPCPFTFETNSEAVGDTIISKPVSIRSILGNEVQNNYGGEYEFDVFAVKLHEQRGQNRGVSIQYGKNLIDLKQEENCSAVYTGVYPYWYGRVDDGTGTNTYVDTLIELDEKTLNAPGTYDFVKIYPLDLSQSFDGAPTQDQIRTEANNFMVNTNIGIPKISIDVSFVQLAEFEEYKNLVNVEVVMLCDYVNVEFSELGVSAVAKCIKTIYNVLTDKYDSVELGEAKSNIASTISDGFRSANQQIKDTTAMFDKEVGTIKIGLADMDSALIKKADVIDLTAATGRITIIESDTASIKTVLAGNVGATNLQAGAIQAGSAVIANSAISSAQIISLSVAKIEAGDISTNKFRVVSDNGNLLMYDNTIQIKDNTRVRVQIGKDVANDYNMYVWDASGNLMFDALGIKASGIKDKIIRDDMVSDTANINATKINITSLFVQMNGSSQTLKASKIYLDTEAQTLDLQFTSLKSTVTTQGNTLTSQGTSIGIIQGQITSKVWSTDITASINGIQSAIDAVNTNITTNYSTTTQTNTLISQQVSTVSTDLHNNYSSTIAMNSAITASSNGVLTTVSSTYATIAAVNNKSKVFTSQPTPPYNIGDLWVDSSAGGNNMVCAVARSTGAYTASDWVKDGITQRITSAESKITDTAIVTTVRSSTLYTNDLSGKVGTSEVISRINQTAESIKIQANKIDIQGLLTVSDGSVASGNLALGKSYSGNDNTNFVDGLKVVGSGYTSFGSGNQINNGAESGYIQIDLGATYRIAESRAFFFSTDTRYYYYKIKYSIDGVTWYYAVGNANNTGWTVSAPSTSGTPAYNPTIDKFPIPIAARYIRLYGNGNNINGGNHIYEWELYSTGQTIIDGGQIITGFISANRINGGILTVGGSGNGNGLIKIYSASGLPIGAIDSSGISLDAGTLNIKALDNPQVGSGQEYYTGYLYGNKIKLLHDSGTSAGYASNFTVETQISQIGITTDQTVQWSAGGGGIVVSSSVSANKFYSDNWFRSTGSTGWYSETYGGGWYMTDSTWIRTYSDKSIFTGGSIQTYGTMYCARICGSITSNDYFNIGVGVCKIDCTGGTARFQASASNYISIDGNSFSVYIGGTTRFAVSSTGTKTGGTYELDGIVHGMAPVDSPRQVIQDFLLDIEVDANGTTINLDYRYARMVAKYGVWSSNGDAKVVSKEATSFTIKGYTGKIDIIVVGYRKDSLDYYYPVMNKAA